MKHIVAMTVAGFIVVCHCVDFVQPYYIPREPPQQLIWEVPNEEVIVKRLQESPAGRLMLRLWPSSPPSKPSSKRYLPYHPVARFRGVNPPDIQAFYSRSRGLPYRNNKSNILIERIQGKRIRVCLVGIPSIKYNPEMDASETKRLESLMENVTQKSHLKTPIAISSAF